MLNLSMSIPIGTGVQSLMAWSDENQHNYTASEIICAAITNLFKHNTHEEVIKIISENRLFSEKDVTQFVDTIAGPGKREAKECLKGVFQELRQNQRASRRE